MSWAVIERIIKEHMLSLHRAINAACASSLDTGCGVKVTYYDDGSFDVQVSKDVPAMTVYEYRSTRVMGYGFDRHKLPYVEKMISSTDTP